MTEGQIEFIRFMVNRWEDGADIDVLPACHAVEDLLAEVDRLNDLLDAELRNCATYHVDVHSPEITRFQDHSEQRIPPPPPRQPDPNLKGYIEQENRSG